jgi:hypothetical protein
MVPEDLLFWIAPIADAPSDDPGLLCRRHADAMVVPRGWTLDDRREDTLRLFTTRRLEVSRTPRPRRQRAGVPSGPAPEQLQIDGTGEIDRPIAGAPPAPTEPDGAYEPWQPEFDVDDDLGGLLHVDSPLLARAFRGRGRPRS